MVRWLLLGCFLGALLLLGGCDSGGPNTTKVSGTVLLDGKPLDEGTINLIGEAGSVPDSFKVKNGKFEGHAKPGKKKVEIHAFKQGPKVMMDKEEVEGSGQEEIIDPRYNSQTTLTAEVTASAINPSEFKVESKK